MKASTVYQRYQTKMQKIADLKYAAAVLEWDQETYMPAGGSNARSRQLATLHEHAYELFISDETGHLLNELAVADGLDEIQQKNIALSLQDYKLKKRLSPAFVRLLSEAISTAYHAWVNARTKNDGTGFIEPLAVIINLKKQQADMLGYTHHPYDALMDEYDRGLTVTITDQLFNNLRPKLTQLLTAIQQLPAPDDSLLKQHFPKQAQWDFGMQLLEKIGFDFTRGRQDISLHPFTTNFSPDDVRVTTRIDENDFGNMTWSCLHEGGHALYEQGLPPEQYGLPAGEYCSLSIHESQSRIWENCVGRNPAYWQHNFTWLQTFFPEQLKQVNCPTFIGAINKVQPSLIRTEADELTYHFHVMIRYEIEKALLDGSINTKDVAGIWNELYKRYLGVTVTDDNHGFLQDIHWSHGSIGYFATYSTGSLYAAQLYAAACQQTPGLEAQIGQGNTSGLLQWLNKNIYAYGRLYTSEELCKKATGQYLNAQYFIDYATAKYQNAYSSYF
jgi:carboxypeptidase Taq